MKAVYDFLSDKFEAKHLPMLRYFPHPLYTAVPHRNVRVQPFGDSLIDQNGFLLLQQFD